MLAELLAFALIGFLGSGDAGTTAFPLLRVPVGSRGCAMGEAFTAAADDANAVFWNSGGLGRVTSVQFGLSHHEWFGGIRDEDLGLALPLGPGCLGIGAVFSSTRDIEIWDPDNGDGASATARSGYAAVGYGLPVSRKLSCGIAAKALYDDLIGQTGTGFCADAGLLYEPWRKVRVGLSLQNLGPNMRYGDGGYALPMAARFGASCEHQLFRLLFDAGLPLVGTPDFHVGGEYRLKNVLALRAGYRLGPQDWDELSLLTGVTAGLGVNLGMFSLDYAFTPYGNLGMVHRLSLNTTLPTYLLGRVRIRVFEVKTGRPVAARFILHGTQQGNSYTEKDGTFVIDGVEPGWLTVTAAADGFYPVTESVLVEARFTRTVRLAATRSGYGSLWGVVYDAATRVPVPAQVVYSGPESGTAETDKANGSIVFRHLKAGDYDLVITPDDTTYRGQPVTVTIAPGSLCSQTILLDRKAAPAATTDQLGTDPAGLAPTPPLADTMSPPQFQSLGDTLPPEPTGVEPEPQFVPLEETPEPTTPDSLGR